VRTPQGQKKSYQKAAVNLVPLPYQQSIPEKTWNRYDSQSSKKLKVSSEAVGNSFKWTASTEPVLNNIPTSMNNNLSHRNNDINNSSTVGSGNNVITNTNNNENRSNAVTDANKKTPNNLIGNNIDRQNLTIREISSLSKKIISINSLNKNNPPVKPMTNDKSSSNKSIMNSNTIDITKGSVNRGVVYNNSDISKNINHSSISSNKKKTSWINTDLDASKLMIAKGRTGNTPASPEGGISRTRNSWVSGNASNKGRKETQKVKVKIK
jgi:hypothetical protein